MVYFIPALFLLLFLVRAFSHFVNGYAFQELGCGDERPAEVSPAGLAQSAASHACHASRGDQPHRERHRGDPDRDLQLSDLFQQSLTLVALLWVFEEPRLAAVCLIGRRR